MFVIPKNLHTFVAPRSLQLPIKQLAMSNTNNTINIDALQYDAHNFNAHTEQGSTLLKESVTENSFGRSIVVAKSIKRNFS